MYEGILKVALCCAITAALGVRGNDVVGADGDTADISRMDSELVQLVEKYGKGGDNDIGTDVDESEEHLASLVRDQVYELENLNNDDDSAHEVISTLELLNSAKLSEMASKALQRIAVPTALRCRRYLELYSKDTKYGQCRDLLRLSTALERFVDFANPIIELYLSWKGKEALTREEIDRINAVRGSVAESLVSFNPDQMDEDKDSAVLTNVGDAFFRAHVLLRGLMSEILVDKVYTYEFKDFLMLGLQIKAVNEAYEEWEMAGFPDGNAEDPSTLKEISKKTYKLCKTVKLLYRDRVTNEEKPFDCLRATYRDVLPLVLENSLEAWGRNQWVFSVRGLGANHDETAYVTVSEDSRYREIIGQGGLSSSLMSVNRGRESRGENVIPTKLGQQAVAVDILPQSPFRWIHDEDTDEAREVQSFKLRVRHFETHALDTKEGCLDVSIEATASADCDSLATKYFERMGKSPVCEKFKGSNLIDLAIGFGAMVRVYKLSVQDAATWGCRIHDEEGNVEDDYEFAIRVLRAASEGRTWYQKISGAGFRSTLDLLSSQRQYFELAKETDPSCMFNYDNFGRSRLCWQTMEYAADDGRKVPWYYNSQSGDKSWTWPPERAVGSLLPGADGVFVSEYWENVGDKKSKSVFDLSNDIQVALKIIDRNRNEESFRQLKNTNFWNSEWDNLTGSPTVKEWNEACERIHAMYKTHFDLKPEGMYSDGLRYDMSRRRSFTFAKHQATRLDVYHYWVMFSMHQLLEDPDDVEIRVINEDLDDVEILDDSESTRENPATITLDEYRGLCAHENSASAIKANFEIPIPKGKRGFTANGKILYKSSGAKDVTDQRPFEELASLIHQEHQVLAADSAESSGQDGSETSDIDFDECARDIRHYVEDMTSDDMKNAYALFKQATVGDCNMAKPSFWSVVSRQKYDAWMKLKGTPKSIAAEQYCQLSKDIAEKMHRRGE